MSNQFRRTRLRRPISATLIINLHVADLRFKGSRKISFTNFPVLDVTAQIPGDAAFLGTGGYHHYVAVNTWAGKTSPPENSIGLISYRIIELQFRIHN
jgi:catechol 2,3-dioxygenase